MHARWALIDEWRNIFVAWTRIALNFIARAAKQLKILQCGLTTKFFRQNMVFRQLFERKDGIASIANESLLVGKQDLPLLFSPKWLCLSVLCIDP